MLYNILKILAASCSLNADTRYRNLRILRNRLKSLSHCDECDTLSQSSRKSNDQHAVFARYVKIFKVNLRSVSSVK